MKKKIFLAVIAIFVICLTCGMLFVACNDKEGKEDEIIPDDETTKQEDVFKDVVYALQDVRDDTTGNKEFNFALDIVDLEKDASVFTLATETIGGEDFFYGAIGSEMRKIKGFDLGGVIEEVLGWIGDSISVSVVTIDFDADGFLSGMIGGIVPSLLGDVAVSDNGEAYYLNLNILAVVEAIAGVGVNFDTLIPAEYSWIIPTVVDVLGIDIPTEGDKDPGLMDVLNFIANNYAINFYFGFGANADVDKADTADNKPFDNFEISERVKAARETDAINILNFEGQVKIETLDETDNVKHTYLLDIGVDVNPFVLLKDNDGGCGLLSLLKLKDPNKTLANGGEIVFADFEIADILEMLDGFGYIHIAMNEVTISGEGEAQVIKPVRNLFTLHYDSEEDAAIVAAALVDAIEDKDYAIGGSYNVSALADIINEIIAQAKKDKKDNAGENAGGAAAETAEHDHVDANKDCKCDVEGCGAAMHVDTTPADGVCDRCKAVSNAMTFISTLIGELTKADQNYYAIDKENGTITVETDNIATYLVNLLMKDPTGQGALVKGIIPQILGGNALRLSVSEKFAYAPEGGIERVEEEDIMYNLREDFAGDTVDEFMASIDTVTKEDGTDLAVGDIVTVTGKGFGTEPADITATGIVMQIADGTYYIGIVTDMYQNLDALKAMVNKIIPNAWTADFELEANWPFYGVLAYTVQA